MILNAVIFTFHLLLLVLPMWLYRSGRPFMAKFYLAMLRSENARKLYVQVLLVLLLLFHYVYVSGHFGDYGAVLSTILCAALFSHKRAMRWMDRLHESRRRFGILALFAMAIAAVPHMYTMSMTIAFLLLASLFYPSRWAVAEWHNREARLYWTMHPEVLSGYYF